MRNCNQPVIAFAMTQRMKAIVKQAISGGKAFDNVITPIMFVTATIDANFAAISLFGA